MESPQTTPSKKPKVDDGRLRFIAAEVSMQILGNHFFDINGMRRPNLSDLYAPKTSDLQMGDIDLLKACGLEEEYEKSLKCLTRLEKENIEARSLTIDHTNPASEARLPDVLNIVKQKSEWEDELLCGRTIPVNYLETIVLNPEARIDQQEKTSQYLKGVTKFRGSELVLTRQPIVKITESSDKDMKMEFIINRIFDPKKSTVYIDNKLLPADMNAFEKLPLDSKLFTSLLLKELSDLSSVYVGKETPSSILVEELKVEYAALDELMRHLKMAKRYIKDKKSIEQSCESALEYCRRNQLLP